MAFNLKPLLKLSLEELEKYSVEVQQMVTSKKFLEKHGIEALSPKRVQRIYEYFVSHPLPWTVENIERAWRATQ